MRVIKFLAAAAIAGATVLGVTAPASAAPAPTPDEGVGVQIIDGQLASYAPWAARMRYNGQEQCSATIIAPTYILSARHCVGTTPSLHEFRIGSLDQHSGGAVAYGTQVWTHPSADLAIIALDRSVSATYSPLGSPGDVSPGQTVQVYGWGATCTDQPEINCQAPLLKYANVGVDSISCSDYIGGTAVCASRIDGITAGGDSGGPMFSPAGTQVGVASTSDRYSFTAYTNVTVYRDWIGSIAGV